MRTRVFTAILVMGFSGLIAEILLLRELLIVFSGNELAIGIILANWLILEALGCFFPGRMVEKTPNRLETFTVITVLFSISLVTAVFLTRNLKSILGVSAGESLGFLPMFFSSFFILLPVSMLHGSLFTFSCRIYSTYDASQDASSSGKVYVYETVGTIIGGIVFTFFVVTHMGAFQVSFGIAILNLVAGLYLLACHGKIGLYRKTILITLGLLILFSGFALITGRVGMLHLGSIQAQWKNQNIVHYQNSQYGNICVIENQGQYIFFQDGIPAILTPYPDLIFIEELVHLPLLAHPDPAKILILSGGAGGVITEILKHPSIDEVEYAELDPLLIDLIRKFPTPLTESELNDKRVKLSHIDGRLLLKRAAEKYDLIFSGILEPSSLQANRYFTREFFLLVQKRLESDGILVLGVPGSMTYMNRELKNLNSCIFHTLKSVFSHVRVIPGDGNNLYLSSDSMEILEIDLARIENRLEERGIESDIIVPWHIERKLHLGWQGWFSDFIEGGSRKINYDFKPLGLFYNITHLNALYSPLFNIFFREFERINLINISFLPAFLIILYFLTGFGSNRSSRVGVPFAIITTGFAGMIFSLTVIFAFQAIYGYVFSYVGLLVASFMAGAACGAMFVTALLSRIKQTMRLFKVFELAILCFSICLPLIYFAVNMFSYSQSAFFFFRILFLAVSFISGLVTGSQFPLANRLYLRKSSDLSNTAGLLYACDLLGGWLGGVIGAVVLLAVIGLTGTCVTVVMLKITSLIILSVEQAGIYKEVIIE